MKTFVIGLDAATWSIMFPLLKQNKLPNIKALMNEGAWGTLRSTIPPMTPLAWTSIITGVNPGKHGIYDFVAQDPKTYRVSPVNYSNLTRPTIWDIFNYYSKKVGVVNFPLAFPTPPVDSFFISGIGCPVSENYAYPIELNVYLKSRGYRIHPRFGPENGAKRYFEEIKDLTQIQYEVTIELMKQWDLELIWVNFQGLDWIQHYLWDASIDGENSVAAFYCYIDCVIGKLLQQVDNDWNIIVLSDHGFCKIKAEIHLNNLLEEWSYLRAVKPSKTFTTQFRVPVLRAAKGFWKKIPFSIKQRIKQYTPAVIRAEMQKLQKVQLRLHELIDWNQTKAFSFGYMGRIYIHDRGKYSQGIVAPDTEHKKIQEEIIGKLKHLKNPITGEAVIGEIFHKEEIYSGDQLEKAPDIIFNSFNFGYMCYGDFGDVWFHAPKERTADHDMEGIIIMKGRCIRHATKLKAETVDFAPTLLYLHSLPFLEDMDGKVLQDAITEDLIKRQKIQKVKNIPRRKSTEYDISKEEEKEIEKQLKDLGYL